MHQRTLQERYKNVTRTPRFCTQLPDNEYCQFWSVETVYLSQIVCLDLRSNNPNNNSMKKIKFSIVAFLALFLSYNAYTTSQQKAEMPDIVKANIEALAYWEYGSDCIEWVDKYCYTEEQFSEIHGPYYYATCSGQSSTPGGKLECGAVESRQPYTPYSPNLCLQCIRTNNEW